MEFLRSLLAMLVPEFLEPGNLMIIGVVGLAESQKLRLIVGSALISGGVLVCGLSCALALLLGEAVDTIIIAMIGSTLICFLGMLMLIDAFVTLRQVSKGEATFLLPERRKLDHDGSFFSDNLILYAFFFGFLIELVQTSALLVFGLAASGSSLLQVFIGTASAHIISKALVLSAAFGAAYLLLTGASHIVKRAHQFNPHLGARLWMLFIKHQIVIKARNEFSPSARTQRGKALCECALAALFILFGLSAWM